MEYSKHSKYAASLYTLYTVYITYKLNSLIPTPSFLIAYSMPKRKGKAWSIYYVNDINVYLVDRVGGGGETVPDCKNELEASPHSVCPSAGVPSTHEAGNFPLIVCFFFR